MSRKLSVAIGLALTAAATLTPSSNVRAQQPAEFEFRGYRIGDLFPLKPTSGCEMKARPDGMQSCVTVDSIGATVVGLVRDYYCSKLIGMTLSFERPEYVTVERGLAGRYGPAAVAALDTVELLSGQRTRGRVEKWALRPDTVTLLEVYNDALHGAVVAEDRITASRLRARGDSLAASSFGGAKPAAAKPCS